MDGVSLGFSVNGTASFLRQSKLTSISCQASTTLDMGRKKKKTNFYKVLSLESETVGFDDIKKAYRSMALRYHPDVCPPSRKDESARLFIELHRAYETLSNPELRREYDAELRTSDQLEMCESDKFSVPRSEFSRETWEVQLCKLMRRSEHRQREKAAGFWRK